MKMLKEVVKFEGYLDEVLEEIKVLEKKLIYNLDCDFDYFFKDIRLMIVDEIIKCYYYICGGIIQ